MRKRIKIFDIPKILLLLLKISGGITFLTASPSLEDISIPSSLVGYRTWKQGPHPSIRIKLTPEILSRLNIKPQTVLKIDAPLAREMKISDNPNFNNIPWRSVKEKQPWILKIPDNQSIYSVYGVFRYHNPINNRYEISPIVHDSFAIKKAHKKITRTEYGYFDWYDLILITETTKDNNKSKNKDFLNNKTTDFVSLQKEAEDLSHQLAYKTIKMLPIQYRFSLEEFLFLNQGLLPIIQNAVNQMSLSKLYYPTPNSIYLEQNLPLIPSIPKGKKQHISRPIYQQILKILYKRPIKTAAKPFTDQTVSSLIIDTRGFKWTPILLLEVINDKGKVVISPDNHSSSEAPFVRYIRDFNSWKVPPQSMLIKAIDINQQKNQIVILEFYGNIIRNNNKQLSTIVNGNFYVLVD